MFQIGHSVCHLVSIKWHITWWQWWFVDGFKKKTHFFCLFNLGWPTIHRHVFRRNEHPRSYSTILCQLFWTFFLLFRIWVCDVWEWRCGWKSLRNSLPRDQQQNGEQLRLISTNAFQMHGLIFPNSGNRWSVKKPSPRRWCLPQAQLGDALGLCHTVWTPSCWALACWVSWYWSGQKGQNHKPEANSFHFNSRRAAASKVTWTIPWSLLKSEVNCWL